MSDFERTVRAEMLDVTRRCAAQGFLSATDGNLSCRLASGRLLITPSGVCKAELREEDLLVVDDDGRLLEGRAGLRATSELPMHLHVYHTRPDISAVLHAHPPYATALTVAGLDFPEQIIPEALMVLGSVPVAPYARPGTAEMGTVLTDLLALSDNILLSHHGCLCAAKALPEALINLERIEHTAKVYAIAMQMGGIQPLAEREQQDLRRLYRAGS